LAEIIEYALSRDIDYVMINTNGIRFARDLPLVDLARYRDRMKSTFSSMACMTMSIAPPRRATLEVKLSAEALGHAGVHVTLVPRFRPASTTISRPAGQFGLARPYITGISFQPATYSGRHLLPADLERRITFPDVIKGIAAQSHGLFREDDFLPLPCAHPNCHQVSIAYRHNGTATPVTRFIDAQQHFDLLANGIASRARPRPHFAISRS
jgi:uncharacterized radical SAM superfamily Fe-S cluster-containing enzyme